MKNLIVVLCLFCVIALCAPSAAMSQNSQDSFESIQQYCNNNKSILAPLTIGVPGPIVVEEGSIEGDNAAEKPLPPSQLGAKRIHITLTSYMGLTLNQKDVTVDSVLTLTPTASGGETNTGFVVLVSKFVPHGTGGAYYYSLYLVDTTNNSYFYLYLYPTAEIKKVVARDKSIIVEQKIPGHVLAPSILLYSVVTPVGDGESTTTTTFYKEVQE